MGESLCEPVFPAFIPHLRAFSLRLLSLASTAAAGEHPGLGWQVRRWGGEMSTAGSASAKSLNETIVNEWTIHAIFSSSF